MSIEKGTLMNQPPASTGFEYGYDKDLAKLHANSPKGGITLAYVMELVDDLEEADEIVEEAKKKLDDSTKRRNIISRDLIPTAFESAGLQEAKTRDGDLIIVKDVVRASIYKDKRPEGHKWLQEQGHDGKIKRKIILDMGKCGQEYIDNVAFCLVAFLECDEDAPHALENLGDALSSPEARHIDVAVETKVEASTITALVKDFLKSGEVDVPDDIFSVFQYQETTRKRKKK